MMHVHGVRAQELSARSVGVALDRLVAVPVDVGKGSAVAMVQDFTGRQLAAPFGFALDRGGVAEFVARVEAVLPVDAVLVRVGVEACGCYHRSLAASGVLPDGWQLVELKGGLGGRAATRERLGAAQDRPDRPGRHR